jgi:hypothetical protein
VTQNTITPSDSLGNLLCQLNSGICRADDPISLRKNYKSDWISEHVVSLMPRNQASDKGEHTGKGFQEEAKMLSYNFHTPWYYPFHPCHIISVSGEMVSDHSTVKI